MAFRAKPTVFRGVRFRSQLEADVARRLWKERVRYEYEPDPVLYYQPRSYTPDFALESGVLLEVKGYFPPDQRQKMRAVKQAHPELDIRFIFTDPNKKLSRARNARTYAQWCEFHGFLWCRADSIPKEWLT